SWGDDGNIIYASPTVGLSRVSSAGGTPVLVTKMNSGERTHRWPQVLPGSEAVLFTSSPETAGGADNSNLEVVSLKTGERKTLQHGGVFARYVNTSSRTGHLVYLRQNTLFAAPFDPRRLALVGVPVPILGDVSSNVIAGGDFAFAGGPSGSG